MTEFIYDGKYKALWVPEIASLAAPTVAEVVTAGEDFSAYIPKDGVTPGTTQNRVSEGNLDSRFIPQLMGTWTSELSVTFFRHFPDDLAWETFGSDVTGFWVFSPFGTPAALSNVYVFPVESGVREIQPPAENTKQKFIVQFAVTSEPELDAVIPTPG
jgi:hypothetical protein